MNDLENRVWRGLRDLADSVPHTPDARARLEGRLTARRSRRPLAIAAAAAVVVAAVAVPIVLVKPDAHRPATTQTTSPSYTPPPGWLKLADYADNGVAKQAGLTVDPDGNGYCLNSSAGAQPTTYACYEVPVWGEAMNPARYVVAVGVLGTAGPMRNTGPLQDVLLFVTAPEVAKLEVEGAYGDPADVREVARTTKAVYWVADFDGPTQGKSYTVSDANGHVLESAIE
jgi:hypothetical protein